MNQFNPKKLLNSKWTAALPENKELHFIVTHLICDEEEVITGCKLEAVMTKSCYPMTLPDLKNDKKWLMGWK